MSFALQLPRIGTTLTKVRGVSVVESLLTYDLGLDRLFCPNIAGLFLRSSAINSFFKRSLPASISYLSLSV